MASARHPRLSDIIFPSAAANVSGQLSAIKKHTLSVSNRLQSINKDAQFVRAVASDLKLPVLANERAGSWYCPPDLKFGSVVFKSTDGHFGNWSFSLRRLNLNLLSIAGNHGGAVIVDVTRQGKHLPDAFTKTIPIWCAVLNRLLFPEMLESHAFHFHRNLTSESEATQIEQLLPIFVERLKELDLDTQLLRSRAKRPFRCEWISRGLESQKVRNAEDDYARLFLCMASQFQEAGTDASYTGYVQGAADDHEFWLKTDQFTPEMMWENMETLLLTSEEDLPDLIQSIAVQGSEGTTVFDGKFVVPSGSLVVGKVADKWPESGNESYHIIVCTKNAGALPPTRRPGMVSHFKCGSGKAGSRDLRKELHKLPEILSQTKDVERIWIACDSGTDISIGVALAISCRYLDARGQRLEVENLTIGKILVRQRLEIMTSLYAAASPSSTTFNVVNEWLMRRQ